MISTFFHSILAARPRHAVVLQAVVVVMLLLVPWVSTTIALQEDPDRVITIGERNSPEQRE